MDSCIWLSYYGYIAKKEKKMDNFVAELSLRSRDFKLSREKYIGKYWNNNKVY